MVKSIENSRLNDSKREKYIFLRFWRTPSSPCIFFASEATLLQFIKAQLKLQFIKLLSFWRPVAMPTFPFAHFNIQHSDKEWNWIFFLIPAI